MRKHPTRAFVYESCDGYGYSKRLIISPRVNGGVDEGIRFEVLGGAEPVSLILDEESAADLARGLERQIVELNELRRAAQRG